MKKSKLIPIEKDNILINRTMDKQGVHYSFDFNINVTFKWEEFKSYKLHNKSTKEEIEYKDLTVMKDPDTNVLYFYPDTVENIYIPYDQYKVSNWSFEDDSTIVEIKNEDRLTKLENNMHNLIGMVSQLITLFTDVKTAGLEQQIQSLDGLRQQINNLKSTMTPNTTYQAPMNNIDRLSNTYQTYNQPMQQQYQYPTTAGVGVHINKTW